MVPGGSHILVALQDRQVQAIVRFRPCKRPERIRAASDGLDRHPAADAKALKSSFPAAGPEGKAVHSGA
jgi:hypothetical protein